MNSSSGSGGSASVGWVLGVRIIRGMSARCACVRDNLHPYERRLSAGKFLLRQAEYRFVSHTLE